MFSGRVDYTDDALRITTDKNAVIDIDAAAISRVDESVLEDPAQGDEEFHILLLPEKFCLLGPFVAGALAALDELKRRQPQIPWRRLAVRRLPWKLRQPGWFGLRLFPVAGPGVFPLDDLPPATITKES